MTTYRYDVAMHYERFFALGGPPANDAARPWKYRRRETSLRLAGCLVLAKLVRERRPALALDLGSGLTTVLLRGMIRELPEMRVVTTDLSRGWLETTRAELERERLPLADLYLHSEWERFDHVHRFDLISVDIGNLTQRVEMAANLDRWLAPGGILVLDDWHMDEDGFPQRMTEALEALGFAITVRDDSIDEAGGFLATAERIQ